MNKFASIVLAAGQGKRMKSDTSKVLHQIGGKPLIQRTIETLARTRAGEIVVVANQNNKRKIVNISSGIKMAMQKEPKGTLDAAMVGLSACSKKFKDVAILYGDDTALYSPQTIDRVYSFFKSTNSTVAMVTLMKENPQGLGRVVREKDQVVAIVEEKDANAKQREIKEVNDGLYFFKREFMEKNSTKVKPSGATGELYLTDLIELAIKQGQQVTGYKLADSKEWHGVNTPEELKEANEKLKKQIHFMGIAGSGASAVAAIAKAYGYLVSGCDQTPKSSYVENLNIEIKKGHSPKHLHNVSTLVVSPAVIKFDPKNEELQFARKNKIAIRTWQDFQGKILQENKFVICVAGGYGKSTTTAMIGKILTDANLDPTVEVGAKVLDWSTNFRVGTSKYYVCEGDEYNNNFLNYKPDIAVILNTAWDHPDFFKSKEDLIKSYKQFIANIKDGGMLIITDDPDLKQLAHEAKSSVEVIVALGDFPIGLKIIGDFRRKNAQIAAKVAGLLKIAPEIAEKSLQNFSGLGRRLEYKGKHKDTLVYDDYAVQPYTIMTTANALKDKFSGQKLVLVLEPHTYTRVQKFFPDFVSSLKNTRADKIFITDVYAAREKKPKENISKKLCASVGPKATYTGSLEQTAKLIKSDLSGFDVVLSMGAGNVYRLWDILVS